MPASKNIERARRGAAWLDEKLGRGWRRKIRRRSLRMEQGYMHRGECGCILAQLDLARGGNASGNGDFARLAEDLGMTALVSHGFVAHGSADGLTRYDELTEAWREVLRDG
jgi:hypothetical protein